MDFEAEEVPPKEGVRPCSGMAPENRRGRNQEDSKYEGSIKEASRFSGTLTYSSLEPSVLSGREGRSFTLPGLWKRFVLEPTESCHEAYPWLHGGY